jgi:hypothetical protein
MEKESVGTVTLREEAPAKGNAVTEESMREEGFLDEEIASAKEHGIIRKEKANEHDGKQVDAGSKDAKQKDVGVVGDKDDKQASKDGAFKIEDLDSFEKVHEIYEKQPDKFRELPRNIKALYHNSKGLYKRAKIEEQKRSDLEKKIEYDSLNNKVNGIKIQKIQDALKGEKITVEDLEAIIAGSKPETRPEPEDNKADEQKRQAEFVQSRIAEADKLGRTEYEDFDSIVTLAQGVLAQKPRQAKLLQDALTDETVSEKDLVDMVVDIARLHKDFGKKAEKDDPVHAGPTDEKVERMLKNSQKKPTSASLGGGGGSRTKSYDDLTAEDVTRMSLEDYKKLPEAVRRRLKEEL